MVALIGGGERPKFSQNTLVVYDAAASEPVMDITFGSPLRKVVTDARYCHHLRIICIPPLRNTLMTRDTLIGTLIESIFVYSIPDGRLLHQGRTGKNPNGIADFRANKLAVPGHKTGSVHVSSFIWSLWRHTGAEKSHI